MITTTLTDTSIADKQAQFTALLEPLHAPLLRFCRAMTRDKDTARDLAAEAILAAYRAFDSIREPKAVLSYLFTTATRLAAKERERSKRTTGYDSESYEKVSDAPSAEVLTDIRILQEAMQQLSDEQREAIVLFEIAGFSIEEIASIQNAGISAVKMRLSRARSALKELLDVKPVERSIP